MSHKVAPQLFYSECCREAPLSREKGVGARLDQTFWDTRPFISTICKFFWPVITEGRGGWMVRKGFRGGGGVMGKNDGFLMCVRKEKIY